ncbi:MAG: primosomal protein N' [Opitutales bacterium]|nr:primosomal protein N' [Opitutales bacterium]
MKPDPTIIVEVRIISRIEKPLTYAVPSFLEKPAIGSLVRIPLMRGTELGIVSSYPASIDFPKSKLRNILEVLYPYPLIASDTLTLATWMASYYGCTTAQVMDRILPPGIRKGLGAKEEVSLALTQAGREVELPTLARRAPKQQALITLLLSQPGPVSKPAAIKAARISPAVCQELIRKGWIEEIRKNIDRIGYEDEAAAGDTLRPIEHALTEEQQIAVDTLRPILDAQSFQPVLLHGVTGSGKTEVYVKALQHVLTEPGATALFLVPEVALAPQTVGTLRARLEALGVHVVVWHSHLSEGERRDSWLRIARGESRVVVGARSAIFTPLNNLRLIIVDEEHEPAYKQEETPRYHGRDLAVYRAKLNNATVILGSATPSLESLYNVRVGKYQVIRMNHRVDNRTLPTTQIVDMRREFRKNKQLTIISNPLKELLLDRFEKREQSILFLNRRGYSTHMICPDCGWVALSEECSIPLTYHRSGNILKCHLTGYEIPVPARCPQCQSAKIHGEGFGTQKVEDVVKAILPRAKVCRIDADTMNKRHLFRTILSDFRSGRIDILVGTQMIAKGLDFPNVTLVALINADQSLYMEDFRAAERTFQLLVQVSGRAGRGEKAGEVIVQTSTPHASPIQFARRCDFDGFLDEEIELRREFNYPPFRHLIRHLIRCRNPEKANFYAQNWRKHLDAASIPDLEIRGPVSAPVEKINGEYRVQLWYFAARVIQSMHQIQQLRESFEWDKDIQEHIDVDAFNLM